MADSQHGADAQVVAAAESNSSNVTRKLEDIIADRECSKRAFGRGGCNVAFFQGAESDEMRHKRISSREKYTNCL